MDRAPRSSEQCQAPVFGPATGRADLNSVLSSVDLDEIFSQEFLLPEGVQGPRVPVPDAQQGGVLQRTVELVTPRQAAPLSLLELCTPQTMPDQPSNDPSQAPSQSVSLAAVERAAALLGMTSPGTRKRQRASQATAAAAAGEGELTGDAYEHVERRIRNREHAKRSRLRKKFMLESLQNQLTELREVNQRLRQVVKAKLGDQASAILDACTESQSSILVADPHTDAKPLREDEDTTTVNIMEQDYRLMHSLQMSQQCFAISDPSLPDNPIVFASPGFAKLTGYSMAQILGRNCRFLQGPGTDQRSVQMIRDAINEERDVSVCLLNYKSDGTPFWNQFFIAPLRACDGAVVNFVGVQCEVNASKPEEMMQRVKRIKNIENLE